MNTSRAGCGHTAVFRGIRSQCGQLSLLSGWLWLTGSEQDLMAYVGLPSSRFVRCCFLSALNSMKAIFATTKKNLQKYVTI